MTRHFGTANTIDTAIQSEYQRTRAKLPVTERAARAHRRGFNGGLAGQPDDTGVGRDVLPSFGAGVTLGLQVRRDYTGTIPSRTLPNGRFGQPKPNPAFKFVADALYREHARQV